MLLEKAIKINFDNLTPEQRINIMNNNTDTYFHNGAISYMGMSRIRKKENKNCNGLGIMINQIAQETYYKCSLCGEVFVTEGE